MPQLIRFEYSTPYGIVQSPTLSTSHVRLALPTLQRHELSMLWSSLAFYTNSPAADAGEYLPTITISPSSMKEHNRFKRGVCSTRSRIW